MQCRRRMTYSVKEAGDLLGISTWLVRRECASGNIHSIRIGNRVVIPCWSLKERLGMPAECCWLLSEQSPMAKADGEEYRDASARR